MKNRRQRNVTRGIRITGEANAFLNARAAELGISGAEYSRRMMFLESWAGIVFEDVRAIREASEEVTGQPGERYVPYLVNQVQRLRQGVEEIDQLLAFVNESVIPQLKEDREKVADGLQQYEKALQQWQSAVDMVQFNRKSQVKEGT